MTRRPAILTEADIKRAIAAARKAGARCVEVMPGGIVRVRFDDPPPATPPSNLDTVGAQVDWGRIEVM